MSGTAIESDFVVARLAAASPHLGIEPDEFADIAGRGPGPALDAVARALKSSGSDDQIWLVLACLTACLPTAVEVQHARRALELATPARAHEALFEAGIRTPYGLGSPGLHVDVVADRVIADVDFCATHQHNTGIQRVVRQTMSRWLTSTDVLPVAWNESVGALRRLRPAELQRVADWAGSQARPMPDSDEQAALVVPFRSTLLLMEVPRLEHCAPLAALAEFSGNSVGLIGYDAIPVVSAETVPAAETERFVRYLSIVKHSDRVVGISVAAAEEFAGFAQSVTAQGLTGPQTVAVSLPVDVPDVDPTPESIEGDAVPSVLCVGSHEPRKNHFAILAAAERLWREGHEFSLRFIGGGSLTYTRIFDRSVRRLVRQGRPIVVSRGVADSELLDAYRNAAFTIFPSLHEGYGLPVAESLSLGVPVITSGYGSTAEIARDGGCILIDPRDDDDLLAAFRSLLTDRDLLERLEAEAAARPRRTWDDYARELWEALVEPIRPTGGVS